jgi:hypothetical protein
MANVVYKIMPGRHVRPVDVFVGGVVASIIGLVTILAAQLIPSPPDVAYAGKLCGYFVLAVGATSAALAILRQEAMS